MNRIRTTNILTKEETLTHRKLRRNSIADIETYLFPFHFSVWNVEANSIFRKPRKHRVIVGLDLTNGKFGFTDSVPINREEIVNSEKIVDSRKTIKTKKPKIKEHIRNYFIHHKRVWSAPAIDLETEVVIYMPYTAYKNLNHPGKNLLLEHYSGNLDLISNHPLIEEAFLPFLKGAEN